MPRIIGGGLLGEALADGVLGFFDWTDADLPDLPNLPGLPGRLPDLPDLPDLPNLRATGIGMFGGRSDHGRP